MVSFADIQAWIDELPQPKNNYLQKFRLYETFSNFYMVGWDKSRTYLRVLKIDRQEPSELNISEDPTTYSDTECRDLLKRMHIGNMSTGGLKYVTTCYGIVGFIKFLGPYYMLIITERRKIGAICGHTIYSIIKSETIPIPNSAVLPNSANSKNENRYKKLLGSVDLRKDFFFSYSYNVMHSLQMNLSDNEAEPFQYERMFVWNEFLTRGIRNHLKNTVWTVALVYGFFKQVKLSISGTDLTLTLIARRSRHYAGTRYLKRGVNEKGRVANDVETEQIVFQDSHEGRTAQISSAVQNRGSIPLFWSQESSPLNIKPNIILSRKDQNYEATRLHFENLARRYRNPIIILNLIKTREKKPRESILCAEFANAIELINKDLPMEKRLKFLHWDISNYSRNNANSVLTLLCKVATYALHLTGIFYCQIIPTVKPEELMKKDNLKNIEDADHLGREATDDGDASKNYFKPFQLQKGILRTNCIDGLDRTNVAQYAYGLVALGHQLHALGLIDSPNIDLDVPLANDLMDVYEAMGNTLALQYGGSVAHNKIFAEIRGQWRAATQSHDFITSIKRYYSNAYADNVKQDAINVFLGYFQPQHGKPALWELNSVQHYNVGRQSSFNADDRCRSFKRSLSDGNIHFESNLPESNSIFNQEIEVNKTIPRNVQGGNKNISESSPEISICESETCCPRYTPSLSLQQLFMDRLHEHSFESSHNGVSYGCSNFLDAYKRSNLINSIHRTLSSENIDIGLKVEADPYTSASASECGSSSKGGEHTETEVNFNMEPIDEISNLSSNFVKWVNYGETLFY